VEVLNDFFQSVFTIEDSFSVPQFASRVTCSLREISITQSESCDKLSSLNPHKAPGPYCLHPCLLKHCADDTKMSLQTILKYTQLSQVSVMLQSCKGTWTKHRNGL